MPLGMEVGLGLAPGDSVLDGDPDSPKGAQYSPHFSAHVYCGQRAGWMKMPLGTEVGLGSGDNVLDGEPAPLRRGTAPNFRLMSVVAKRLDGSRFKMPLDLVRRYASAQATLC